MKAYRGVEV